MAIKVRALAEGVDQFIGIDRHKRRSQLLIKDREGRVVKRGNIATGPVSWEEAMTRVLIVDDDEAIRNLFGQVLGDDGFDCALAADAAEARKWLKKQDFELIISDIMMPGESGLDFIKYVLAEHPDSATLMITVVDDPSIPESLFELGLYGYLTKPLHVKNVLLRVSNALHRRRLEIDNRAHREIMERLVSERTAALHRSNQQLEQALNRLKETQAQMIQSEKMASVGQLAAGIAHEINNPTGFVSSNLATLSEYQSDITTLIQEYRKLIAGLKDVPDTEQRDTSVQEKIDHIRSLEAEADIDFILGDFQGLIEESHEGTARITRIVADLKHLAHPGEDKLGTADINKSLDSTLNVVRNEIMYKATVSKQYGDLPIVNCYPQQLNQVFTNLLVNAGQAIKDKGEIKIVTQVVDECVEIKISDTGMGIPEENLPKLFDPFFTTKELGKRTGLGLNIAYDIINKHNGSIQVESKVGKGTVFTIRIPVEFSR
ncbi:MAG: response regulator [Candidatus Eisenbacteria sp.]|nr:response regulator [Candidatus Eisenbacteria bacterium]